MQGVKLCKLRPAHTAAARFRRERAPAQQALCVQPYRAHRAGKAGHGQHPAQGKPPQGKAQDPRRDEHRRRCRKRNGRGCAPRFLRLRQLPWLRGRAASLRGQLPDPAAVRLSAPDLLLLRHAGGKAAGKALPPGLLPFGQRARPKPFPAQLRPAQGLLAPGKLVLVQCPAVKAPFQSGQPLLLRLRQAQGAALSPQLQEPPLCPPILRKLLPGWGAAGKAAQQLISPGKLLPAHLRRRQSLRLRKGAAGVLAPPDVVLRRRLVGKVLPALHGPPGCLLLPLQGRKALPGLLGHDEVPAAPLHRILFRPARGIGLVQGAQRALCRFQLACQPRVLSPEGQLRLHGGGPGQRLADLGKGLLLPLFLLGEPLRLVCGGSEKRPPALGVGKLAFQGLDLALKLVDPSAAAPELPVDRAGGAQPLHSGVVIVEIVGVVHKVAELGTDGRGGPPLLLLPLGQVHAAHEGVCVQLEQLLPQALVKAAALGAVIQVPQGKGVPGRRPAEGPPDPVAHPLKLEIQAAAVGAPLPGKVFFSLVPADTAPRRPGEAVQHGLEKGRQRALAEAVGLANHRQAVGKRIVKVRKPAKIVHMTLEKLHIVISSPVSASRPARIIARLSSSSASLAITRRMNSPLRDTSFS